MSNTSELSFKLQSIFFTIGVLLGGAIFPFRKQMSMSDFQAFILPYIVIFLSFIVLFFQIVKFNITRGLFTFLDRITIKNLICVVSILFVLLTFGIMLFQNKKFSSYGYCLNVPVVCGGFSLVVAWLLISFSSKIKTPALFATITIAYVLTTLMSIAYFPLHPERSDMLPLIEAAGRRFLDGESPYSLYSLPHTLPLTYLPGMWLSYVPAVIADIDLRLINLFCIVLSMILIYRSAEKNCRENTILLLAIFLLNPWFQFRHEIYLGVYILPLVVTCCLLIRNKPLLSSVFFSWTMSVYQLSWIIYPLFLIYVKRNYGMVYVVRSLLITLLMAAFVIFPFFLWSPEHFVRGIFLHWKDAMSLEAPNFTFWILKIVPLNSLVLVQGILLLVIFSMALKKMKGLTGYFQWCTFTLFLFITTNKLIWHYFFFILFLYMIFFEVAFFSERRRGILSSQEEQYSRWAV